MLPSDGKNMMTMRWNLMTKMVITVCTVSNMAGQVRFYVIREKMGAGGLTPIEVHKIQTKNIFYLRPPIFGAAPAAGLTYRYHCRTKLLRNPVFVSSAGRRRRAGRESGTGSLDKNSSRSPHPRKTHCCS
jgi:hypothetical protein